MALDVHTGSPIRLTVRLLGRMSVHIGERPVRLAGRQSQALLALLVLRPRSRTREAIATDLWPDAATGSTGSLRQALWLVRSALASAGTDPDRVIDSDAEFDRPAVRRVASSTTPPSSKELVRGRPARPEEALQVYRGELAEGFAHECFARDRERLADAYEDALAMAAESRLAQGDLGWRTHGGPRAARARPAARGGPPGADPGLRRERLALAGPPPVPAPRDAAGRRDR